MNRLKLLAFVVCSVVWIVPAHAATRDWYVAVDGSDGAADNWDTALTNIQAALDVAQGGDTIYVAGRRFTVGMQLEWRRSEVTLRGGYAATNALDAPGPVDPQRWPTVIVRDPATSTRLFVIRAVSNAVIERVTFEAGHVSTDVDGASTAARGGGVAVVDGTNVLFNACCWVDNTAEWLSGNSANHAYGGGLYAEFSSGRLLDPMFIGNRSAGRWGYSGYGYGGGMHLAGGQWTISNLVAAGNVAYGQAVSRGGALHASQATVQLHNALVINNRAQYSFSGAGAAGLHASGGSLSIDNATVHGHARYGVYSTGSDLTVRNSILYNNLPDIDGTLTPTLEHNCIGDGTADGQDGNFQADPLFEYPLLYLATNSPCLGAGDRDVAAAGVTGRTSLTNGATYAGAVNLGYHFAGGLGVDLELYVCPDTGNDTHDGLSPVTPLQTLTHALDIAAPRTRIHLAAGRYIHGVETFPLRIDGGTLQLRGTNRAATVLDASGANTRVLEWDHAPLGDNRIEGMTITGGDIDDGIETEGGGLLMAVVTMTIRDTDWIANQVRARAFSARRHGGGMLARGCSGWMEDVGFLGNQADGRAAYNEHASGGGLYLDGGHWIGRHVVLAGNVATGQGVTGGGLYVEDTLLDLRNALIVNNRTTSYQGGNGIGGGIYVQDGDSVVAQATIHGHTSHGVYSTTPNVIVRNSIVYENLEDIAGLDSTALINNCIGDGTAAGINGNFQADPRFEYPLFYLAADSPCLGAGDRDVDMAGVAGRTSLTNGVTYTGDVNLGYHFAGGLGIDEDLYVCTSTGDDGNDGLTALTPLKTITQALAVAGGRTRIHLAAGRYGHDEETFPLTIHGKTVQLTGTNRVATVIDASNSDAPALVCRESPLGDNRLSGLTITGGDHAGPQGGGLFLDNVAITLRDCLIVSNRLEANYLRGGGVYAWRSMGVVEDVEFQGNSVQSRVSHSDESYGGALALDGGYWRFDQVVVRDNQVLGRTARGAGMHAVRVLMSVRNGLLTGGDVTYGGVGSSGNGGGLYLDGGLIRLENCTLAHNACEGFWASGDQHVWNTILWGNTPDFDAGQTPQSAFHYSLASDLIPGEQNNLNDDPGFADAAAGDYRLSASSSCVDTGVNRAWMTTASDLSGNPRILRGRIAGGRRIVDRGAYERIPPPGSLLLLQ